MPIPFLLLSFLLSFSFFHFFVISLSFALFTPLVALFLNGHLKALAATSTGCCFLVLQIRQGHCISQWTVGDWTQGTSSCPSRKAQS